MTLSDDEARRRRRFGPRPDQPESAGDAVAELLHILNWLYETGDDSFRVEVDEWERQGLTRLEMAKEMYRRHQGDG